MRFSNFILKDPGVSGRPVSGCRGGGRPDYMADSYYLSVSDIVRKTANSVPEWSDTGKKFTYYTILKFIGYVSILRAHV